MPALLESMKQGSIHNTGTPCRRCQRRQQTSRGDRLCERCESEYRNRRGSLSLSLWRVLGFLLVIPLIVLTWNTPSPLGDWAPGLVLGHSWLILLGIFAGEFLSKRLTSARVLLFRHRFENESP